MGRPDRPPVSEAPARELSLTGSTTPTAAGRRPPRPRLKGITPRRLAAARRALQRERNRHPLFAVQIAQEQESPQARIDRIDLELLRHDQARRDLAARHWRWGRRMLLLQSEAIRREILNAWNRSSIPAEACYFADFVRRELRSRGIPD